MPTKKPEQELRDFLNQAMRGYWHLTWHEDGQVNPGVPDVSFVFRGNCETGWLELKAERYTGAEWVRFGIRADQITWIRTHRDYVPVFVLCQWGDFYYLFDGKHVEKLNTKLTRAELEEMMMDSGSRDGLRAMLIEHLQQATDRFRNVE